MHLPDAVTEALGFLAYGFSMLQPFLPTYTHLILSALFPIYTGAHASLSRPSSAAQRRKRRTKNGKIIEDEPESQMEGLSASDAIVFPVLAGCTLTGLYYIIKWLEDPALLNKILGWYFAFFSVFSVTTLVSDGLDVFHSFLFPHEYVYRGLLYKVRPSTKTAVAINATGADPATTPLPGPFSRLPLPTWVRDFSWYLHVLPSRKFTFRLRIQGLIRADLRVGIHTIEGFVVGLATVAWFNLVSKPWWLTNLMGFGFAYGALQLMSPTTFGIGTMILCALFFYDIYFVFYTPMMVTVAKSLDIPIKLLFPRPSEPGSAVQQLSMLGLGDVVLPGIMIGLALRFDLFLFYLRQQRTEYVPSPPRHATIDKVEDEKTTSEDGQDVVALDAAYLDSTQEDSTENTKVSLPDSQDKIPKIIKAPYRPVYEGWGDGFWTSIFSRMLYPRAAIPTVTNYKPLGSLGYKTRNAFPKPYFHASLVGYVLGMVVTLGAMQISDHPQPALLYLVPGVVGSLWLTGLARGEIKEMWNFSDAEEEEENDTAKKNDKSKKDDKSKSNGTDELKQQEDKKQSRGIFSLQAADERDERIKKWMGKHVEHKNEDSVDASSEDEAASKDEKNLVSGKSTKRAKSNISPSNQGKKLFEFSIFAPLVILADEDFDSGINDEDPTWTRSDLAPQNNEEHVGKKLRVS